MVVASSVRPYRYVGPYPFSGSGVGRIGFSGILFEQAMFALNAEEAIYVSGASQTFTKYVNRGASISSGFIPSASGDVLNYRANVNFKNYILDMRTKMSGLFGLIQTDSEYSSDEIGVDYMKVNFGDNPSGSIGTWRHSETELGNSGLYDIDLREVSYQPYTRIGKYEPSTFSGWHVTYSPISPAFCSKNGLLVSTSDRDVGNAAQMDDNGKALFAYSAAWANYIAVFGDMIVPGNTKLYVGLTPSSMLSQQYSTCEISAARILEDELGSGLGFFRAPNTNLGTGIYGIKLANTNANINGYYVPQSGTIGIWPKQDRIVTSGYIRATVQAGTDEQYTSGFHIFNTALWQFSTSGAALLSPINGMPLWYRFSDNQSWSTTNYGPRTWAQLTSVPATPIVGANNNLVFYVGTTLDLNPDIVLADRRFVFAKYNPVNFNFVAAIENSVSIPAPLSQPSVDRFLFIYNHNPVSGINLSNYYCLSEVQSLSSGPEIYILNNGLENVGAWDNATNPAASPLGMINGHLYGYNPTATGPSGALFRWHHLCFKDPLNVFPMSPASADVVDSAVHVWEIRDTAYDNTNGISTVFEPMNQDNFSVGGIPLLIDPRGTDLDYGDGSTFLVFYAKMKGETTLKAFLGRINEGTIGGNDCIVISEFIPLSAGGVPSWVYSIV